MSGKPTILDFKSQLDFSFVESDKVQRCTMEICKLIEKELSQTLNKRV